MKRLLALAAGILWSFFLIAQVNAAADGSGSAEDQQVQQAVEEDQGIPATAVDSQAPQAEMKGTPTTPAAAMTWQAREKARRAVKERAILKRQQEMNQERANAPQVNQDSTATPDQQNVK